MTRINLVPVEELMDQHLFAEFREIKMVPKSLRRSLEAAEKRGLKKYGYTSPSSKQVKQYGQDVTLVRIPPAFTLNTGHVSFFYDKGAYLQDRFHALVVELIRRGFNFDKNSQLDEAGVFAALPARFNQHYTPTPEALALVRERIALRISQRPGWYRYYGEVK